MTLSYTVGYWPNSDIIFMHEMENHNGDEKQKDEKICLWKEQWLGCLHTSIYFYYIKSCLQMYLILQG